jgi:glucose 1-dehydrogenase
MLRHPAAQISAGQRDERGRPGFALHSSAMPTHREPLAGRRALVTGGATGIGRATAKRLAADGASVVVNYVGPSDQADSAVGEIEAEGGRAFAVEADVSQEDQVAAMFGSAADHLGGPVDLLVNNAGIEKPFKLVDMPLDEWNKVLSVNLTGAFLCSREAARGMLGAGIPGAIVNVSSVHEVIPWPEFGHYCASKGGMKLFAQTIARELAPSGIRVVNVAPGAILTPINQDLIDNKDKREEVESEIPLGRTGKPEEIAAAIAWVAGPEAEYVVGTTLFVDGGMTLYPKFV